MTNESGPHLCMLGKMARVNFRPAGVSDSSEDDDFVDEYRSKRQYIKRTVATGNTNQNLAVKEQNKRNEKRRQIASLGKEALPLEDFRNAATKGDFNSIKKCLEKGVPVDQEFASTGWTALMHAGTMANFTVMKYLLEKGANPNFLCKKFSVLMATCSGTRNNEDAVLECVQALADRNVDVNAFDRYQMSPLLYAAKIGRSRVVEKLIDLGANINKQDNRGYTALHFAASKGHVLVVQVLLEKEADVLLKSSDGSTAADIAFVNGKERISIMLRNAAAGQGVATSGSISLGDGDAITSNEDLFCNGSVKSETEELLEVVGSMSSVCTYGDLEIFLSGLELSNYIQLFQRNRVTFPAFLRMTDHDLQQLGIHQMGHRKKILDAIHATHKKDWESSSLSSVQYNKQIKISEAIATVSNINKHAAYISSTVGYITDQIKAHPEILRTGQHGSCIDDLAKKSKEGFTNVQNLYCELCELHKHLNQVSQLENFHPPDLILKDEMKRICPIRPKRILLSILGLSMMSFLLWKRDSLIDVIKSLTNRS